MKTGSLREKLGKKLVATSVALGLGFAATASQTAEKPDPTVTASTAQMQEMQSYFDSGVQYWEQRGVQGMEDIRLRILSGVDHQRCFGVENITSSGTGEYCGQGGGTIVIPADDLNTTPIMRLFTMQHELGHGVEDKTGRLSLVRLRQNELGATCLAGVAMRDAYPLQTLGTFASDVLNHTVSFAIGSDFIHGTGEQQETAFSQGFTASDCSAYNQSVPVLLTAS